MKVIVIILFVSCLSACNFGFEFIKGNGNLITQTRPMSGFSAIGAAGDIDIEIEKGNDFNVSVQADENLMRYILVDQDKNTGKLEVKLKKHVHINSSSGIRVLLKMPVLKEVHLAGSGSVKTTGQMETADKIKLSIAGSGDLEMDLKSPAIAVSIAGSGKAIMKGETRDLDIHISGSGDYLGEELKSEKAKVSISGSGNVNVYSSLALNVSIAGSGDVIYLGNPKISKSIVGSGSLRAKN